MKKLLLLFIISIAILPFAFAEDDPFEEPRAPFGISDRAFEIGFDAAVDVSNNFLSIGDILSETLIIDLDKLKDGFRMNLGMNFSPFFFNVNVNTKNPDKNQWGFGLSTAVDAYGILNLSGDLLTFSEADNSPSDASGAVFASATLNTYFHIQKFKVRLRPSMYYTAAYAAPGGISYTLLNHSDGTSTIDLNYDMRFYLPINMDQFDNGIYELTATPGFDLSVGVEYPLSKAIGLTDFLPIFDMDVGVDFINIPIYASSVTDYTRVYGNASYEGNILDEDQLDELMKQFENLDPEFEDGTDKVSLERPFKMLAYINWRPLLGSRLLTVTPTVGFSINQLYSDVLGFEFGLNACLNIANLLRVNAGINYMDRVWINRLDLALNLRAIELNLGASLRSPDFLASWSAAGLGVNVGFRIGW